MSADDYDSDLETELEVLPPTDTTCYAHVAGAADPSPINPDPKDLKNFNEWHAGLVQKFCRCRPNDGERFQMQILLTNGASPEKACLLRVLNTSKYDALFQLLSHPVFGLGKWRSKNFMSVPLALPKALSDLDSMVLTNALIGALHNAHEGKPYQQVVLAECSPDDYDAFVQFVVAHWDELGMPAERILVNIERIRATKGDVVVWKSFHGSARAAHRHKPHVSMFVDYAPRSTVTTDDRRRIHEVWRTKPMQFGAGLQTTRNSHYNARYNHEKKNDNGGLSVLDADADLDAAHYFLGNDSIPPPPMDAVLTDEHMRRVQDQGWVVVPGATMRAVYPRWDIWCDDALQSLTDYLNWVVLEDNGFGHLDWRFDLSRTDDPHIIALSGSRRDAAAVFDGDQWALYKKCYDGQRTHTAQNGNVLITGVSGMGAATNLYDSPSQLNLELACASIAQQLYGTRELMMVPERMRVKVGTSKQSNELAMHSDTLIGTVVRMSSSNKRGQQEAELEEPAKKK